jgi:heat shock protein HslJ
VNRTAPYVTAAVVVMGALSGPAVAGATAAPSPPPLVGTHWILTGPRAVGASAADVTITALFDGSTVSGESGCNAYHATYEVRGQRMTIGKQVASTLRSCPRGPTAVERAYLQRLSRVASFRISGEKLSLADRRDHALLTYRAAMGAQEIVGRWEVTGYYTGSAIASVVPNSTLTAEFLRDEVSGDGGCNTFGGPYEVQGNTIRIGPLSSTLRACADEALNTQESQYLMALELAATFSVTGSRLELLRADGGIAVSFEAATR